MPSDLVSLLFLVNWCHQLQCRQIKSELKTQWVSSHVAPRESEEKDTRTIREIETLNIYAYHRVTLCVRLKRVKTLRILVRF